MFVVRSLALAVLVAMLVGCSSNPLPTTTPSPLPTGSPIDATWQVPTPSPYQGQALNGLVTYPGNPLTFEYPAEWRMITGGFYARHYEWFEAVLGTGDWRLGCTQSVDTNGNVYAVTCGDDAFVVGPGQVVVALLGRDSPAFVRPTPPPEVVGVVDGLPYTVETSGSRTTWRLYGLDGWPPLDVVAEFGDEPSAAARGTGRSARREHSTHALGADRLRL